MRWVRPRAKSLVLRMCAHSTYSLRLFLSTKAQYIFLALSVVTIAYLCLTNMSLVALFLVSVPLAPPSTFTFFLAIEFLSLVHADVSRSLLSYSHLVNFSFVSLASLATLHLTRELDLTLEISLSHQCSFTSRCTYSRGD